MALGVLNNLSAIYAENNLNNTNASLQKVLQQLSSGSRINSGADDAAGLSLVNGLEANSTALTQSSTNATEGVGLLQVADGALSQVTNLLDRAITLATEASNGTLNSTQASAANQEYQSILSEINNIGSTTTFNQQQVFNGESVAIYTGDSSTSGSSIDDLSIRSLSEASVGDSSGVMSYTSGQNNVFLNLSTASQNASRTDNLNPSGTTTINVGYLVNGANGQKTTASTQISVGTGTGYTNNVSGLISAINGAGLGLTASFTNQASAGVTGGGDQTGIEITGGLVSAGFTPSAVSTSGILDLDGLAPGATLAQGATVTIGQGTNSHTFTIGSANNTLATLAGVINGTAGLGVTATVVANGDGTQSLSLADSSPSGGALSVTTTLGTAGTAPAFSTVNTTTGVATINQVLGSYTAGVGSVSADNSLSGSFVVTVTPASGPAITETFVMGGNGTYSSGTNTYSVNGNTLTALANAIAAQNGGGGLPNLHVSSATAGTTGNTALTVTEAAGYSVSIDATGATYTNTVTGATPPMSTASASGTATVTVAQSNAGTDAMTGSLAVQVGGTTYTFVIGAGGDGPTTFFTNNLSGGELAAVTGATKTDLAGLEALIDARIGTTGTIAQVANASITSAGLTITSIAANTAVAPISNMLQNANALIGFYTPTLNNLAGNMSTGVLGLVGGTSGNTIVGTIDNGATLSGKLVITNNGVTDTFVMGDAANGQAGLAGVGANAAGGNTIYTGAYSLASLVTAMNDWGSGTSTGILLGFSGAHLGVSGNAQDALDLSASTTGAPGGGIYLQSTLAATTMSNGVTSTLAVDQSALTGAVTVGPVNYLAGSASTLSIGTGAAVSTADMLTGSITITNTPTSGSPVKETFVMGTSANSGSGYGTLNGTTFTVNGDTLEDLQNAINSQTTVGANSLGLGLTALAGSGGLSVSTATNNGNAISETSNSLVDTAANLTFTGAGAYNVGLSGAIADTTTGQTAATFTSDSSVDSGIATISYSDGSGQALNGTNLLDSSDAESALNDLNSAISDVAAQDGYIGAQINTLNSLSQVMSTQQENIVSAQNAIQATDYASATSNMSKFEILSQTGIAALAQANSVEQEVTKLLQ